ncbi:MAG TPA: adenosylhomocysteinase [Nitrososphaeraceae archaeon]|nr:adenosylhomocysteinase [Nitrososphaeraceae archaeon]
MKIRSHSSFLKSKNKKYTNSTILLETGKLSYEWALYTMKIISKIRKKYERIKPLTDFNLGFCLHITKETSVLLMAAKALGANISICSANPMSVQEDIVEFLKYNEMKVFATKNQTKKDFFKNIIKVLNTNPDIVTDDGAELHSIAHNRKIKSIIGGTEETTSGIFRILSLQSNNKLNYPIIGVNEAKTKHLFDNRYGTGQSTIDGLLRTLGILIAGKHFVVCGYGWVGKGVSSSLRGLGAKVTITEVDPIKALEAHLDGFNVQRLKDVLPTGDCFITCTGQRDVISKKDFSLMKNGVFLANAGHFDVEIDIHYLQSQDKFPKQVRPYLECYNINGKKIHLIAKGRVINLIAGEGNASEVMDLSFANQLLSIIYIAENYQNLKKKLHQVPKEIDEQVAHLALSAFDITIDKLSQRQIDYYHKYSSLY